MKCNDCRWFHHMMPCIESPHGEVACMKLEHDLWGVVAKDVENCEHYERYLPKATETTESTQAGKESP